MSWPFHRVWLLLLLVAGLPLEARAFRYPNPTTATSTFDYDRTLGEGMNGDPSREGGGLNLYQFCDGDPVNRVDPWGLDTQLKGTIESYKGQGKGTLITITADVKLFWKESEANANLPFKPQDAVKQAGELWSIGPVKSEFKNEQGPIYLKLDVKTELVEQDKSKSVEDPKPTDGVTWNYVTVQPTATKVIDGRKPALYVEEGKNMTIAVEDLKKRAYPTTAFAHEFGHLLLHGDAYDRRKPVSFVGWKNNLMSLEMKPFVESKNILEIIAKNREQLPTVVETLEAAKWFGMGLPLQ